MAASCGCAVAALIASFGRDGPALMIQTADVMAADRRIGDTVEWTGKPGTYVVCGPVQVRGGFYLIPVRLLVEPEGHC